MDIITYALSKKNTGGSSGATEEQATQIQTNTNNISELKEEIGDLTLGLHTDGLVYLFKDGQPIGIGIELGTVGDVVGIVDSENNIVLTVDNLPDGTYNATFVDKDGNQLHITSFTLGQSLELFVPATCVLNKRLNSSGVESDQNGTFVTDYIDIGDLAVGESRDILFSGFQIQMNRASSPYTKIDVYDTAKSRIGLVTGMQSSDEIVYDASGTKTFKATVTNPSTSKTARYIKITGHLGEDYSIQGTNAITSVDQLANCSLILA